VASIRALVRGVAKSIPRDRITATCKTPFEQLRGDEREKKRHREDIRRHAIKRPRCEGTRAAVARLTRGNNATDLKIGDQ